MRMKSIAKFWIIYSFLYANNEIVKSGNGYPDSLRVAECPPPVPLNASEQLRIMRPRFAPRVTRKTLLEENLVGVGICEGSDKYQPALV